MNREIKEIWKEYIRGNPIDEEELYTLLTHITITKSRLEQLADPRYDLVLVDLNKEQFKLQNYKEARKERN